MARLTSLEDQLRCDASGSARDALLARLLAGERQLQQQLRQPHSLPQRQAIMALLQACEQSAQVIAVLWARYHPAAHER